MTRMFGSLLVYGGGLLLLTGFILVVAGFALPAPDQEVAVARTHLDELVPRWQFHEVHSTRVDAPPAVVYEAMRQVRADEILFFRTLTWIRRGGRKAPESILNAGERKPLIDVATSSGFAELADDPPRELVIGTVVIAPPGARGPLTAEFLRKPLPPGYAVGVMNFLVVPDGDGSVVSTETRVFASGDAARRRFKTYWRMIYPGSAMIRRMWLRAIERRAERA